MYLSAKTVVTPSVKTAIGATGPTLDNALTTLNTSIANEVTNRTTAISNEVTNRNNAIWTALNRTNKVNAANTSYTTSMARGVALYAMANATAPVSNGGITLFYA